VQLVQLRGLLHLGRNEALVRWGHGLRLMITEARGRSNGIRIRGLRGLRGDLSRNVRSNKVGATLGLAVECYEYQQGMVLTAGPGRSHFKLMIISPKTPLTSQHRHLPSFSFLLP
jgi:hypothetical protein